MTKFTPEEKIKIAKRYLNVAPIIYLVKQFDRPDIDTDLKRLIHEIYH